MLIWYSSEIMTPSHVYRRGNWKKSLNNDFVPIFVKNYYQSRPGQWWRLNSLSQNSFNSSQLSLWPRAKPIFWFCVFVFAFCLWEPSLSQLSLWRESATKVRQACLPPGHWETGHCLSLSLSLWGNPRPACDFPPLAWFGAEPSLSEPKIRIPAF